MHTPALHLLGALTCIEVVIVVIGCAFFFFDVLAITTTTSLDTNLLGYSSFAIDLNVMLLAATRFGLPV